MLGAATLTKPEGLLFAAAALVPFVAIARTRASLLDRARRRADPAAVAHLRRRARPEEPGVQPRRRDQSRLPRRPVGSRAARRSRGVWHQVWSSGWGWLVPVRADRLRGRAARPPLARWRASPPPGRCSPSQGSCSCSGSRSCPIELTLSWAAYRTVASLVIGAAALAPLLAAEAWSVRAGERRSRRRASSSLASSSGLTASRRCPARP